MRVIFLDIDGVLNSRRFLQTTRPTSHGAAHLDPRAIERLNRIVTKHTLFVLSSAWRTIYSLHEIEGMLVERGFVGSLYSKTPSHAKRIDQGSFARGDEIAAWLLRTPGITSFVIFDDGSDMSAVQDRLVQTHYDVGLTDDHVEQAQRVLDTPLPPFYLKHLRMEIETP